VVPADRPAPIHRFVIDMRNVVTLPIAKSRTANRRIGTIGSRTELSHRAKTTSSATPAINAPTTSALDQPTALARLSAQTRATTPAVTSPTPTRSSRSGAP
jgi:hypothetical protein